MVWIDKLYRHRRQSILALIFASTWCLGISESTAEGTVSFSFGSYSVSEAGGTASILVMRHGSTSGEARIDYSTSNGSALAGIDYQGASGTLVFANGESTKTIFVSLIDDDLDEIDETVALSLTNPQNCFLGSPNTATLTIQDNDDPPTLTISDESIVEGNAGTSTLTFTVSLNRPTGRDWVFVQVGTQNMSATAPSDYFPATAGLFFFPPQTSRTVAVTIRGDSNFEPDESFSLVVTNNPQNVTILKGEGVGLIVNDDCLPPETSTSTLPDVIVGQPYAFEPAPGSESYSYAVTSGTVPPGMSFSVESGLSGIATEEGTYMFSVSGTDMSGCVRVTTTYTVSVIVLTQPALSIDDISVIEQNKGRHNAVFTVTLSEASTQTVTVQYATADGSSTVKRDYVPKSGTLTFEPGSMSKTISIQIKGEKNNEEDEIFVVNLSNPLNATIDKETGTCIIINDDFPKISISNAGMKEGDAGTTMMKFAVTLSKPRAGSLTVNYNTMDGTALADNDYEATSGALSFAPGEKKQFIEVPIYGDDIYEDDEEFTVELTDAVDGVIVDGTGRGRIHNDENRPRITMDDAGGTEGNSGTTILIFTVALSHPSAEVVTVEYSTEDATARSPGDFTEVSGTLTFNPGEVEQSIIVEVNGDLVAERDEYFRVRLRKPEGGVVNGNAGKGSILDDDTPDVLAMFDGLISFTQSLPGSAFKNPSSKKQGQLVDAIEEAKRKLERDNPRPSYNRLQTIINQASGSTYFSDSGARQAFLDQANALAAFLDQMCQLLASGEAFSGEEVMMKKVADAHELMTAPTEFALRQNYPNPFNPSTTIRFDLAEPAFVSLKIYNIAGELVATLAEEFCSAGAHGIQWNALNVPSGLYIYRLQAGVHVATQKMTLVK